MKTNTTTLIAMGMTALLAACAKATPEAREGAAPVTAEPAGPSMTGAELTTAVDKDGRSAAPASTEFGRDEPRIHLVARLHGLAPGSRIEVEWIPVKGGEPLRRTTSEGAGDHSLVSTIHVPTGGFEAGDYRVHVSVDGTKLGEVPFHIGGRARDWTGVRGLQVASAVTAWTNEALSPGASFPDGTRRIHAVFQVRTNDPSPFVRVTWLLDGEEQAVRDLECGREVRCLDTYEDGARLASGDWEVEIAVNGEVLASRGFHVGGEPVGPMLEHAALGVAKGKKQMPKRSSAVFEGAVSGLRCGVRVSTLPDEAAIKVTWIEVTEGGDVERHRSEETVSGGGTRVAVLDWPIDGALAPGRYKAVVAVGSRKLDEIPFEVR